jgi:HAD superfamily phosphoserine phosphatase-like hydrolase
LLVNSKVFTKSNRCLKLSLKRIFSIYSRNFLNHSRETTVLKYKEVSLFDLDKTLLIENSSYQFGTYLYEQNFFSFNSMLYFVVCYSLHRLGMLSVANLHNKIFNRLFKNHPLLEFQKLAGEFLIKSFDSMIYPPALQKLDEAKKNGHWTVILSSSPHFLVQLFAERFEVNEWAATTYIVNSEDRFLDISKILDGEGKAEFLFSLSQKIGIPVKFMTAYSDSFIDLPFLKAAGQAVGVNPDYKLRAICYKNKWDII